MRDRLLQATILTLLLQVLASMSSSTSIQAKSTIRLQAERTSIPTIIDRLFNLSQTIQTKTQEAQASFRLPE